MNEISPIPIANSGNQAFSTWQDPQNFHDQSNFKEYLGVIRKNRLLIAALAVAAVIIALAWYFARTPQYKAAATILIEPSSPQVIDELKGFLNEQNTVDYDYYKTQFRILTSATLAARVIHENDFASSAIFESSSNTGFFRGVISALSESMVPAPDHHNGDPIEDSAVRIYGVSPDLIKFYTEHLSVEPARGTQLVVVAFTTSDPRLSAEIANAHVRTYIRQGLDLHAQTGKNVEDFLQQKLVDLKEKVEQSEAALNKYRRDRGIVTLENSSEKGGNSASPLMQRLEQLNAELTQASSKRIAFETEHQSIAKGNLDSLPEVIGNTVIQNLKEQVAQLSIQYAAMSNRYNQGYHPLDDLQAKLDEEQKRLAQEIGAVAASVDSDYRASSANEEKLREQIEQVKAQALALNDASLQEAVLERQVEASRQLYQSVLQRMNEISVAAEVPASNVSVVDRAMPPRKPTGPALTELLVFALTGAVFSGIMLAFFLESMDDTLKVPQEVVRYLRVPSFGFVPDFRKFANGHRAPRTALPWYERRDRIDSSSNSESGSGNGRSELIVAQEKFSTASETYRAIRTAIMFSRSGGAPKVILITSATIGEGKTLTSCNIAAAFAHTGNRTLIVDADLRRSRCHEVLGVDAGQGLTEVLVNLREVDELITPTSVPGLSFLAGGMPPPNPSELLASPEMMTLIGTLRQKYDYVIFDSAPVMPVSDSLGLSTMVDGVVMLAGGSTSRKLPIEACSRLLNVGARILGVVLNRVDISRNLLYYRYGHYGYYESYKPSNLKPDEREEATHSSS
jgi:polysaccharide biosynthesis transport protein